MSDFEKTLVQIVIVKDAVDGACEAMFDRVREQCSHRQTINDATTYCKEILADLYTPLTNVGHKDNCYYRNCPIIHGYKAR